MKKVLLGTGALGAVGCAVGVYRLRNKRLNANSAVTPQEYHEGQMAAIKEAIHSDTFITAPKTLYQYTTCPFCTKVRTFLDYHGVEYNTVEVNPLNKQQISSHDYGKVPQLQIGDEDGPILVDSAEIVKILKPILDKEAPDITPEEQKWKDWAGSTLVRYMVLNTNRTLKESREGYDYVSNIVNFSGVDKMFLQLTGGPIMYIVAHLVVKKKLKDAVGYDGSDPREALYKEIDGWVEKGLHGRSFHGGEKPDTADLDVYGVLQSQRFLPVFKDIRENNKACSEWIDRMDALLPAHYKY